jgi:hypothetical protein
MQAIAVEVNIMLEAALAYAGRGWPVLPIEPQGKRPLREWGKGVHDATTDPEIIRSWWTRWPSANVAIALPPGIIGVDVDGDTGRANLGAMPPTPAVNTGRGYHYYLRAPKGVTVRNGVGVRPGIDIRATGGYLVAPPSVHATGVIYDWTLTPEDEPLADCPEWIAELLTVKPEQAHKIQRPEVCEDRIPEGYRNATLFGFGCRLRGLGLTPAEITRTLLSANAERCAPPLAEAEVRCIARNACGYPAGALRVDRRIANADLKDGPRLLAMLLQAGVEDHHLAEAAGVTDRTLGRWWSELRAADLEGIARTRPTRRYCELPRGLVTDQDLTTGQKITALAIGAFMKDGVAQVGEEQLCEWRSMGSRNKLSGHITALERAGYLVPSRTLFCNAKGRRDRPNRYRWAEAEMRLRDNEMAREAPVEAREAESMTERARIRARGQKGHVTTDYPYAGPHALVEGEESDSTPSPSHSSDGGAKAPSAVVVAPGEVARALAIAPHLSADYAQRMIAAHGAGALMAVLTGGRV